MIENSTLIKNFLEEEENTKAKISRRILTVLFEDDISEDKQSDKTQVTNALDNGGEIHVLNSKESLDVAFDSDKYED